MLVFERQPQEYVVITLPDGRLVKVYATRVEERRGIKLSFDAPRDVVIDRSEIYERKAAERAAKQCH